MRRTGSWIVGIAAAVAVIAAGCTSSGTVRLRAERTGLVEWEPCGDVQCASLTVPLDASDPGAGTVTLALARLPAAGRRIGVLFTNPGGPGGSGVAFLRSASSVFGRAILEGFDLVSWDPRGTGGSSPVRCDERLDAFYAADRSPDSAAERDGTVAVTRRFVDACRRNSGALLEHVGTAASVRDMDAIRAAMGEESLSFIGFSYGSYLGARYADAHPNRVHAMVLDGAIDPTLSFGDATVQQAAGFERALERFLDWCRRDAACGFARGGDPRAAFADLARAVDDEPLPGEIDGEARTLGPGEFDIGVASALYGGSQAYPELAAAIVQAAQGLGDRMLRLADTYTDRRPGGRYSSETAALYAVGCLDSAAPRGIAEVEALAARAAQVAPTFGASSVWLGLPCTLWPVSAQGDARRIRADGAPPILVVGTTHDPATPYSWAEALARGLGRGRLLTFDGDGHTAYGRGSECVDRAVERYLLTGDLPPEGTRCR
jgi:pimeloyl-ACP methyl ester carboxylesterase